MKRMFHDFTRITVVTVHGSRIEALEMKFALSVCTDFTPLIGSLRQGQRSYLLSFKAIRSYYVIQFLS